MWDNRRAKRTRLLYYLKVYDDATVGFLGHLIDITPGGLLVLCGRAVEPDTELRLRMALPTESGGSKDLILVAKSVWCKNDLREGGFKVGFQLQELSAETREVIDFAIREHAFRE